MLRELQTRAHAIAKEKGWWDRPRTFGELILLVHCELSEAVEAYRDEKIVMDESKTAQDR